MRYPTLAAHSLHPSNGENLKDLQLQQVQQAAATLHFRTTLIQPPHFAERVHSAMYINIYIYKSSFTYTYHYTVPLYSTLISYYIHTNLATLLPLSHKHCNRECNAVELPPRSFHPMSHDGAGGGRATGHLLSLCRWRWLKGHQTAGVESGGWPKAWMMDG